MENDLAEYVRRCFQGQYKKKGENFCQSTESTGDNAKEHIVNIKNQLGKELKNRRKEKRDNIISQRRNIKDNQTPFVTPKVKSLKMDLKYKERLDKLAAYKAEKLKKKLQEANKKKPIFKVCSISKDIGLPKLDNVNNEIKGKLFKSSFAPEKFQFKPPANIQPIPINETGNINKKIKSRIVDKNSASSSNNPTNSNAPKSEKGSNIRMVTRSQTRNMTKTVLDENNKNLANINIETNNRKDKKITKSTNNLVVIKPPINNRTENKHQTPKRSNKKVSEMAQENKVTNNNKTTSENESSSNSVSKLSKIPVTPSRNKKTTTVPTNSARKSERRIAQNLQESEDKSGEVGKFVKIKSNSVNTSTPHVQFSEPKFNINDESYIKEDSGTKLKKGTPHPVRKNKGIKTEENATSPDIGAVSIKTPSRKSIRNKSVNKNDVPDLNSKTELREEVGINNHNSTLSDSVFEPAKSSGSTDYPFTTIGNSISDSTPNTPKTPNKKLDSKEEDIPMYISPFVTVSRGKDKARKEYQNKQNGDCSSFDASFKTLTSPKAGAAYFRKLLNEEILRIQGLCSIWTNYKETEQPIEEACSMIDVAIGQSQLLITKKFEQFRNLINECESSEGNEKPVTCTDLHGFWDLIYIQVENLSKRFANLEKLKANNWQEFFPEIKKPLIKKTRKASKPNSASSLLKDAIKAARLKQKSVNDSENKITFNGGFFSVQSPEMKGSARKSNQRKSLLNNVSNSTNKRNSSPGLAMLRVSNLVKSVGNPTPNKSILKKSSSISSTSKTVVFENNKPIKTNLDEDDGLITNEAAGNSVRRSARFVKTRLFD